MPSQSKLLSTKIIKDRRSIRSYKNKKVSKKIILEIIKLANLAPTAGGKENRRFIIIKDIKVREKIFQASLKQDHLKHTPVIIAVTFNKKILNPKKSILDAKKWGISYWGATEKNYTQNKKFMQNWKIWENTWPIQDADAAITTLCLAAKAFGLGTCWIGLFEQDKVKKILKIPQNYQIAALITLGYQKDPPYPQKRKKIKELIS